MVLARGRHAGNSEAELLQTLLEACGQCEEVPEAQVDTHTGLSGSGVAFVSAGCSPPHIRAFGGLCGRPPAGPWAQASTLVAGAPG